MSDGPIERAGGPWAEQAQRSPWREAGIAEQAFGPGLYVVATPIGNAADVSLRALWILARADCIAAEDTRTTAPLLARFGIDARLLALHQHNEAERIGPVLERLARGERVALVTDAGTPAISDPGALLVRAALAAGVRVVPVPGPSSMTAALSVAGVRCGDIRFVGFAPPRAQARARLWSALAAADGAAVVFEAPHRLVATARELHAVLDPQRRMVIARELTKRFEEVVQIAAGELPAWAERAPPRGEYVLVIDAAPEAPGADAGSDAAGPEPAVIDPDTQRWLAALAREMPASRAAAIAARVSGLPRALLYRSLGRRGADAAAGADADPGEDSR